MLNDDKVIYAGLCNKISINSGECIKIMTGAMIPDNCNAVQMWVEWTEEKKRITK
ncbi:hypothetical protein OGZ02_07050 [Brachyspira hyodysenteriae]|nr:hypothetical protein [Brachyspira hyodysenteriae]